jgi:ketosteroid isomerase-like protein
VRSRSSSFGFTGPALAQQNAAGVDPAIIQQLENTISAKYNEAVDKHDAVAIAPLYTENAVFLTAINKGDAAAVAANYTEDGVAVEQDGPTFGREAIQKLWADRFQNVQFSNNRVTLDEGSPNIIGTDGKQMWATGSWSATIKGKDWGPKDIKGYWTVIREGDDWKIRNLTNNVTPEPTK